MFIPSCSHCSLKNPCPTVRLHVLIFGTSCSDKPLALNETSNTQKCMQTMAWLVQIHRFYRDSHNMHASWVCGSVRLQRQVYDPAELAWIDTFSEGIKAGLGPRKPQIHINHCRFQNMKSLEKPLRTGEGEVEVVMMVMLMVLIVMLIAHIVFLAVGCIKLAKSPLVVLVLGWFGLVTPGHSTDTIVEHSWVGFCPSLIFQYPNALYCVFSTHSSTGSKD